MSEISIPSPVAAAVWTIDVKVGDEVVEYDILLMLESMKTEIPVESPTAGRVKQILVEPGDTVSEGQALMLLET